MPRARANAEASLRLHPLSPPHTPRYGVVVDKELQQARHERGRTDQWGFVVFKNVADARAAYEDLCGKVGGGLRLTRDGPSGGRLLHLKNRGPRSV